MKYLKSLCDFCSCKVDERGKRTQTNAVCFDHLTKANSIPKKAGKKVINHGGHVSVTPSFGGSTGHKAPIHGSGF